MSRPFRAKYVLSFVGHIVPGVETPGLDMALLQSASPIYIFAYIFYLQYNTDKSMLLGRVLYNAIIL